MSVGLSVSRLTGTAGAGKTTLKKPEPLTAGIIADMKPGEERGDAQCPGLRVRCSAMGKKVFFYRYRAADGTLREIRLGDVGPLMLAKARNAALRKRLEHEEGKDPQLEKRKERAQATRERMAQQQETYSVEDLLEEYIQEVLSLHKRGAEATRLLNTACGESVAPCVERGSAPRFSTLVRGGF
jgi:Arm DNA-binding domain